MTDVNRNLPTTWQTLALSVKALGTIADIEPDLTDAADQARQVDPVQHWMKAAGSSSSLDDLLGQQHGIDSVIQGLDPLGGADVLAPESFDSVMHLFAPDGLRAPVQESLQKLVQHSLPGLTQREHHSMSLDSAMPFTGGEHSAAPSPTQIDSAPSSRT